MNPSQLSKIIEYSEDTSVGKNWMSAEEVAQKLGVALNYLNNTRKHNFAWLPEPLPMDGQVCARGGSRKLYPRVETERAIAQGRPRDTVRGWNRVQGIRCHVEVWCNRDGACPAKVKIVTLPEDPEDYSEELSKVEEAILHSAGYLVYLDVTPIQIGEYPIGRLY